MYNAKVGAGVLEESEKCLEVARKNTGWGKRGKGRGRRSVQRRMVKALGKVKVKFGSTNFFEQQTPFNLVNHALNTSVNAMLLY